MDEEKKTSRDPKDAELEREIRLRRKYSLAEAIGRLSGGLMKGTSPVTGKRQAELQIEDCLEKHLRDAQGALEIVLLRRAKHSDILLESGYEQPIAALVCFVERILGSAELLERFTREVDAQWGRMYQERPYFEKEGEPPHREDPYTVASVRTTLSRLVEQLCEG